jgi:hypothetical protein
MLTTAETTPPPQRHPLPTGRCPSCGCATPEVELRNNHGLCRVCRAPWEDPTYLDDALSRELAKAPGLR